MLLKSAVSCPRIGFFSEKLEIQNYKTSAPRTRMKIKTRGILSFAKFLCRVASLGFDIDAHWSVFFNVKIFDIE